MDRGGEKGDSERDKASMELMEQRARDYQLELFEFAKKNNTIVRLGTGTGKTFISVLLIKHFEHQIAGDWVGGEGKVGGKRTLFLAPKVPLVEQQRAVLEKQLSVKVQSYVGVVSDDRWTDEYWQNELQKNGVIVMTPEFYLQVKSFFPMRRINLIVFDECHRATGDDAYVRVMKVYRDLAEGDKPRILGLTASAVASKVSGMAVAKRVRELEAVLCSVAKTASRGTASFGTKPSEVIVVHENADADKLPVNQSLMDSLSGSADYTEFRKSVESLKRLYETCGEFCTKKVLEFRERALRKALESEECTEDFRKNAEVKFKILEEMRNSIKAEPSPFDCSPKLKKLLDVLKVYDTGEESLCGLVFVEERIVAFILYEWLTEISKHDDWKFLRSAFIVGQGASSYGSGKSEASGYKMNARAQNRVLKDFRDNTYNIMFGSSVIEEGIDVPVCNLVVRFDLPPEVRSYTQSKGRARAKPSMFVLLSSEKDKNTVEELLTNFQETEQIETHCCEQERQAPDQMETMELLKDDPSLPSYVLGDASITASSALSLLNWYSQTYLKLRYSNVFPEFIEEQTDQGFVCSISMPIFCPIRRPVKCDRILETANKARISAALQLLKALHKIGELNDHLIPRIRIENVQKIKIDEEDLEIDEALRQTMVPKSNERNTKKRFVLPRAQAECLTTICEGLDCEPEETFHLYVLKTQVERWANAERKWNGEDLFDPAKHSITPALILSEPIPACETLPQFPIYTRSGEELVDVVYAGTIELDEEQKKICRRFNHYVFMVVLEIWDKTLIPTHEFSTPTVVVVEKRGDKFNLSFDTMKSVGPPKRPPSPFKLDRDLYEDSVVQLLYHMNENLPRYCEITHTKLPEESYRRFYVNSLKALGENGEPLTPESTGVYSFSSSLSIAEYMHQKEVQGWDHSSIDDQPVLRVEPTQERLEMICSRAYSGEKDPEMEMTKEDALTDKQPTDVNFLLPQFAVVHALKASVWRKLTSLPSILYRLNRILVAESLRSKIARDAGVGQECVSERWQPMTVVSAKEAEPIDEDEVPRLAPLDEGRTFDRSHLTLKIVEEPSGPSGPSPGDVLKAITSQSTNEFKDSERLQLLGKSFLRIVATFSLYDSHPKATVGELQALLEYQTQNKNLLRRAHQRDITSMMETVPFKARVNFLPPSFKALLLEHRLLDVDFLRVLFDHYDFDGYLEPRLKDIRFADDLFSVLTDIASMDEEEFEDQVETCRLEEDEIPARIKIPVKSFQDFKAKTCANIVESLAGLYLVRCGTVGAFKFLKWIGLSKEEASAPKFVDIYDLNFHDSQVEDTEWMDVYGHVVKRVETKLGHSFKNPALVLEAISHHSCREHSVTRDNGKLAFVGGAVLDFLISNYLFNLKTQLTSGQLSDLHEGLMSSQVAAHAIVKSELHSCLLYMNGKLFRTIRKYLEIIDDVGLRLNTVLGDWEIEDAEEAEIPEPLGLLLHSLIGAVFIDSGKDLDKVWRAIVSVMGYEISYLTTNIPISPVKELMRDYPETSFGRPVAVDDDGKLRYELTLFVRTERGGEIDQLTQVADSKKMAKIILAKRFLRKRQKDQRLTEVHQSEKAEENIELLTESLLRSAVYESKFYRKNQRNCAPNSG